MPYFPKKKILMAAKAVGLSQRYGVVCWGNMLRRMPHVQSNLANGGPKLVFKKMFQRSGVRCVYAPQTYNPIGGSNLFY
jgi:hypothetical protein